MLNKLQNMIYTLSAASPVCIIYSIVWYCHNQTLIFPITLSSMAIVLIVLMLVSFNFGKKNGSTVQLRVNNISPKDNWIYIYIFTYLIPVISIHNENNIIFFVIAIIICVFVIPLINSSIPNPILFFSGYHFYAVSCENGISDYILISKRKLRNKKELNYVKRIFEFVLIDGGGN